MVFRHRLSLLTGTLVVGFSMVAGSPAWAAGAAPDARPAPTAVTETRPARETFLVQAFANTKGTRSLEYLSAALPGLVAERLGHHEGPLRFVGGPTLLAPERSMGPAIAAKWIVDGAFERQADWKMAVRVTVKSGAGVVGEATELGAKDDAPGLALAAASKAFVSAGVNLAKLPEAMQKPFGRDPYAFVLYGRGVAAYVGLGILRRSPERALDMFKRALVIDPKIPEVRRYLGFVHLEEGRPTVARMMWTYALDLRANYLPVLRGLAALDRTAGLPTALERYARVVELDPRDTESRRSLGELYSDAGKLDQAQAELEKVVQASPNDLRARRALTFVLAAQRAGNELVAELEQLVKLDPEDVDARMDLAAAYSSIGKLLEAESAFEEVLAKRPRHPAALKLAGDLARTKGDVAKASALYGRLRAVSPRDPRPVFLLGATQYEAGNLDAAERLFTEGSRYPGMMGDAYSNLGAIALRRGHKKEALWLLSRAAKRRPSGASVRFNYAMALAEAERHADALNELRAAETLDPSDSGIRFFSGVVALRLGLLLEAERSFRETLRIDPRHEDARHNLGLLEPLVRTRREASISLIEAPPAAVPPAKSPAVRPAASPAGRQP